MVMNGKRNKNQLTGTTVDRHSGWSPISPLRGIVPWCSQESQREASPRTARPSSVADRDPAATETKWRWKKWEDSTDSAVFCWSHSVFVFDFGTMKRPGIQGFAGMFDVCCCESPKKKRFRCNSLELLGCRQPIHLHCIRGSLGWIFVTCGLEK